MSNSIRAIAYRPWSVTLPIPALYLLLAAVAAILLVGGGLLAVFTTSKVPTKSSTLATYARFFYASFLKPHTGDGAATGQQAALESFYKAQVCMLVTLSVRSLSRAAPRQVS